MKITSSVLLKAARKELEKNYHILSKKEYAEFEGDTYARGYQKGEKHALRDIPKWIKTPRHGKNKPTTVGFSNIGEERLYWGDFSILISELEKLPHED